MQPITIGTTANAVVSVTKEQLAVNVGSGSLEVFATPMMAALMEQAACKAMEAFLEADETTVGTSLELQHTAATPEGMQVTAEAEIVEVNGREITFQVKAYDTAGIIGSGTHKRFMVKAEKFMSKAASRKG